MSTQLITRTTIGISCLLLTGGAFSLPPSGLDMTIQSIKNLSLSRPSFQKEKVITQQIVAQDANTTFEQLEKIKNIFALKVSELAEIFDSSRPTIYAWLNGSSPQDNATLNKIHSVAEIAQRFKNLSFKKPEAMLKRPALTENQTLLHRLKLGGTISDNELQTLREIDLREAKKRAEAKVFQKRHGDIDTIITPIIIDPVQA